VIGLGEKYLRYKTKQGRTIKLPPWKVKLFGQGWVDAVLNQAEPLTPRQELRRIWALEDATSGGLSNIAL
jgi:hypothetical protein